MFYRLNNVTKNAQAFGICRHTHKKARSECGQSNSQSNNFRFNPIVVDEVDVRQSFCASASAAVFFLLVLSQYDVWTNVYGWSVDINICSAYFSVAGISQSTTYSTYGAKITFTAVTKSVHAVNPIILFVICWAKYRTVRVVNVKWFRALSLCVRSARKLCRFAAGCNGCVINQ